MLLSASQSVLLYPSLVHVKYEVNLPCDESVFYVPELCHNL